MPSVATILDRLLICAEVQAQPPVLADVGASGEIHRVWAPLARYSICLAFDPDDREFSARESSGPFLKTYRFNRAISPHSRVTLYLTASPYCSSTLRPDEKALQPWAFRGLFTTQRSIELPAITLAEALLETKLNHIDWLKTDTQGTDLSVYQTLTVEQRQRLLIAELEPGINRVYQGEENLSKVLETLLQDGFWLDNLLPLGAPRAARYYPIWGKPSLDEKIWTYCAPRSHVWAELRFCRSLSEDSPSNRDLRVATAFAIVLQRWGWVLDLAARGATLFPSPVWAGVTRLAQSRLRTRLLCRLPLLAMDKLLGTQLNRG